MVTIEDIEEALMDPTERGSRAIGRALVLLYTERFGGKHQNPMGIACAQYFLNHKTLTDKQLAYWRRILKENNKPHILLHADELLEIARIKEQRRKKLFENRDPLVQPLLNKRDELLELAQDLIRSSEPSMYESSVKELRAFELRHHMTPASLQIDLELEDKIMQQLHDDPTIYLDDQT
jgi:hypothetical protein